MTGVTCTEQLVDFTLGTRSTGVPPATVAAARRVVLDTVACTLAGLGTESGRIVAELKKSQGGRPEATLYAAGIRLPCAATAYVLSQAANALDADECLFNRTHFAVCIVPSVLAFAEMAGTSGRDTLAAIAVGFDVAARLCLALPFYEVGPDNEVRVAPIQGYSASVFGVVAGLGRVLALTPEQLRHAFGIAYASVPAQRAHWLAHMAMTKYAMFAAIAEAGSNAAMLARKGYTGDPDTLEPKREFWRGLGADRCDYGFITRDLGRRWFIEETSLKLYPAARPISIVIDLFADICRRERLAITDIEEVVVRTPPSRLTQEFAERTRPASTAEAALSASHALAMVAEGIPAGPRWADPAHLDNESLRAFMRRTRAEPRPEWQQAVVDQVRAQGTAMRVPTEVVVRARGALHAARGECPRGDPGPDTRASTAELEAKFRAFAEGRIATEAIERAISEIWALDEANDLRSLMVALA